MSQDAPQPSQKAGRGLMRTGCLLTLFISLPICICLALYMFGSLPSSDPVTADDYVEKYGGSRDVYAEILSSTNCAGLQETNDRAWANRDIPPGNTWTTGYMTASDARMKAIGCYDESTPAPTAASALRSPLPPLETPRSAPALAGGASQRAAAPTYAYRPTITVPPTYTLAVLRSGAGAVSISGSDCSCSGNLYNCSDFATHAEAQACFDRCAITGVGDVHKLDQNSDGAACESLP